MSGVAVFAGGGFAAGRATSETSTELAAAEPDPTAAETVLERNWDEPPVMFVWGGQDAYPGCVEDNYPAHTGPWAPPPEGQTQKEAIAADLDDLIEACGAYWHFVPTIFISDVDEVTEGATGRGWFSTREGYLDGSPVVDGTDQGFVLNIVMGWEYLPESEIDAGNGWCQWLSPEGFNSGDAEFCHSWTDEVTK